MFEKPKYNKMNLYATYKIALKNEKATHYQNKISLLKHICVDP